MEPLGKKIKKKQIQSYKILYRNILLNGKLSKNYTGHYNYKNMLFVFIFKNSAI